MRCYWLICSALHACVCGLQTDVMVFERASFPATTRTNCALLLGSILKLPARELLPRLCRECRLQSPAVQCSKTGQGRAGWGRQCCAVHTAEASWLWLRLPLGLSRLPEVIWGHGHRKVLNRILLLTTVYGNWFGCGWYQSITDSNPQAISQKNIARGCDFVVLFHLRF